MRPIERSVSYDLKQAMPVARKRDAIDGIFFAIMVILLLAIMSVLAIMMSIMSAHSAEITQQLGIDDPELSETPGKPEVVHRAADGMFYVHAKANGNDVRLLVDTGASMSVINSRDASLLGIDRNQKRGQTRMITMSGMMTAENDVVPFMQIGKNIFKDLDVAVIENSEETSLLGENALKLLKGWSVDGDTLTLGEAKQGPASRRSSSGA